MFPLFFAAVEVGDPDFSGLQAEVDMSGNSFQFRFMKLGTSLGQVNRCAAISDPVIGVLTNKPKLARAASIKRSGIAKVVAGAAITRGAFVYTDTTGRAIAVGTGMKTCGICRNAPSAAGEMAEIELMLGGVAY